ncbi:MAG TPA: hypothetical protein VG323_03715, partial [Thermoanaerobaculia bacterium]|nr:hypothetical protein [Thermoanaerobaculia bacterium]
MRSLALVLVLVAAAAFADVPVDVPQLQADTAVYPAAATNGDDVVVTWESFTGYVRVARVRGDGTVIDVPAKLVGRGQHPAIACGGGRCVVLFEFSGTVEAAFLSADLDVLRRVRFSIQLPNRVQTVAANDDGFLVTWQSNDYDSAGVLLTRDGDVFAQFAIHQCIVASAGRGGEFLIAARPTMNVWPIGLYRVTRDGSLTAGPTFNDDSLPGTFLGSVALASSPNGFLLAYGDSRLGVGEGSVVELDAALQARGPRSLLSNDVESGGPVSAAWDGTRYVVAFSAQNERCEVLPRGDRAIAVENAAEAALAATSRGLFVAVRRQHDWSIDGYVMPSFAATPAPFTVAYEVAKQFLPAMATDGRSALVTWVENERGRRVALVLPSGERRDIPFDHGPSAVLSSLAFDGRNYVMIWTELFPQPDRVYAQVVSPDGALLG